MVARDGIEPPTPAFQGRLASELSALESADVVEAISVMASSIEDGLGRFGLLSAVRWSCIGRVPPTLLILDLLNAMRINRSEDFGSASELCRHTHPYLMPLVLDSVLALIEKSVAINW